MEKGVHFDVNCQNCGSIQTKHVNDFTAVQSMKLTIIGLVISVIVGIVMLFMFEGYAIWISGFTYVKPIYFWNDQIPKTKGIGAYRTRRK